MSLCDISVMRDFCDDPERGIDDCREFVSLSGT